MSTSVEAVQQMLEWLQSNGGYINPSICLKDDPITGISLFTKHEIPPNERLIGCPVDLIITPQISSNAICERLELGPDVLVFPANSSRAGEEWNERMRICVYICLHWIFTRDSSNANLDSLQHWPYIASLPPSESLSTPLHFNADELHLLENTNLLGAVTDRRKEWIEEYETIAKTLHLENLTWDMYLTAATYLSSRAFPSSLLSSELGRNINSREHGTEEYTTTVHPVMIPGWDLLNHASRYPIRWQSAFLPDPSSNSPSVSIESVELIPAHTQVYNNYGPRSNEELLLGYGFVIPDNPDDTVVLKLGTSSFSSEKSLEIIKAGLDVSKRYHLRRDGEIPQDLLKLLRILLSTSASPESGSADKVKDEDEDEDEHAKMEKDQREFELELDVLNMLGGMIDDKLAKIEIETASGLENVRSHIRRFCEIYRQGQKDILTTTLDKLGERIDKLEKLLESGMICSCCM